MKFDKLVQETLHMIRAKYLANKPTAQVAIDRQESDTAILVPITEPELIKQYGRGTKWDADAVEYLLDKGYAVYILIIKANQKKYAIAKSPSGRVEAYDQMDNMMGIEDIKQILNQNNIDVKL